MDVRRVRRAWNRRVPGPDGVPGFTAVVSLATVALNASTSVTPSGTEGSDNSLPPRVHLGLVVPLDAQSRVASSPGAANMVGRLGLGAAPPLPVGGGTDMAWPKRASVSWSSTSGAGRG